MGTILARILGYLSRGADLLTWFYTFVKQVWNQSNNFFHGWGIVALITSVVWPYVEETFARIFGFSPDIPTLVLNEIIGQDATNFIKYLLWQFQLPLLFRTFAVLFVAWLAIQAVHLYAVIIKIATRLIP